MRVVVFHENVTAPNHVLTKAIHFCFQSNFPNLEKDLIQSTHQVMAGGSTEKHSHNTADGSAFFGTIYTHNFGQDRILAFYLEESLKFVLFCFNFVCIKTPDTQIHDIDTKLEQKYQLFP